MSSNIKIAAVPIRTDALYISSGSIVAHNALANYAALPQPDNPDNNGPFLASGILSEPFDDRSLELNSGVHLHWQLPDAMRQSIGQTVFTQYALLPFLVPKEQGGLEALVSALVKNNWIRQISGTVLYTVMPATKRVPGALPGIKEKQMNALDRFLTAHLPLLFPPVPDLWLVTRNNRTVIDQQWMVESAAISDSAPTALQSNIPFMDSNADGVNDLFRYIGKTSDFGAWSPSNYGEPEKYVQELTAVGFNPQKNASGFDEPTYSEFYPNCATVFGLCDNDTTINPNDGSLSYDITGLYSKPDYNALNIFILNYVNLNLDEQNMLQVSRARMIQAIQKFDLAIYEEIKKANSEAAIQKYIQDFINSVTKQPDTAAIQALNLAFNQDILDALENAFHWAFDALDTDPSHYNTSLVFDEDKTIVLPRFLAFSSILGIKMTEGSVAAKDLTIKVTAAIGNTGTESLAAFLASKLPNLEDQIDTILYTNRHGNSVLDINARIEDYIHERGFRAQKGGSIWKIKLSSLDKPSAKLANENGLADISEIPVAIADKLNEINTLQQTCDLRAAELISLQESLYADWNKYAYCEYEYNPKLGIPQPDDAANYIQNFLLPNLDKARIALDNANDALQFALSLFKEQIAFENNTLHKVGKKLELQTGSAPDFWTPNDPVVLLFADDNALKNPRLGDGLSGSPIPVHSTSQPGIDSTPTNDLFSSVRTYCTSKAIGKQETMTQQPWNPFLLEWETSVKIVKHKNNQSGQNEDFAPQFVSKNYQFDATASDFKPNYHENQLEKTDTPYQGYTLLTPNARNRLHDELQTFLLRWCRRDQARAFCSAQKPAVPDSFNYLVGHWKDYLDFVKNTEKVPNITAPETDKPRSPGDQALAWFKTNLDVLLKWYLKTNTSAMDPAVANLAQAYAKLDTNQVLAQSLGGFNLAQRMQQQARQLPVADPCGFDDQQKFAALVASYIQNGNTTTPEPENAFIPIRNGQLTIERMRLADSFGQIRTLSWDDFIVSQSLKGPTGNVIELRPRFNQPARLLFDWLSADKGTPEINSHPATTPICGWILPNNLDNSLEFYDQDGRSLGTLTRTWQPAPGVRGAKTILDINNDYLRRVALKIFEMQLQKGNNNYLQELITTLDNALSHIEPIAYAEHPDLALLMGRPIAVVRAQLQLQTQGLPAHNLDWADFTVNVTTFKNNPDGFTPVIDTAAFEKVIIPVRLGETGQFNDGLVGYWPEQGERLEDTFYSLAAQGAAITNRKFSLDGGPRCFTMLVDPAGKIHASCGLLPVQKMEIPADLYKKSLQRISVTFRTTPVLMPQGLYPIPLPRENGYQWSWLEQQDNGQWLEVPQQAIVSKIQLESAFSGYPDIWQILTDAKWISPHGPLQALLNPVEDRQPLLVLEPLKDPLTDRLEQFFKANAKSIQPVSLKADFEGTLTLREGWLKLSPDQFHT